MPSKNVLAILSGIVAVALAALAVFWQGQPLAIVGATAGVVGVIAWGVSTPARRSALVLMALAVGSRALFVHFDHFLGLFVAGLVVVWSAFGLLRVMDGIGRLRVGFGASVFVGAFVALWPTADGMLPSAGGLPAGLPGWLGPLARAASVLHCPVYIKDRV